MFAVLPKFSNITIRKAFGKLHYTDYSYTLLLCYILHELQKTSAAKWKERPLKDPRKIYSSLLATYLITLKVHLENLLLKDFYKAVDCYSTDLKNMTLYDASQNVDASVIEELSSLLKQSSPI